jgi:YgiT-type zinc finger domain-containing protein
MRISTQCSFCDGELEDAFVQHTYRWRGKIYVFEDVPAQVCRQCGERYFDAKTIEEMERIVLSSAKPTRLLQVPVFSFKAAA